MRAASLTIAAIGASITTGALGPWWTPVILLVATAGALWVTWRVDGAPVAARVALPVLVIVVALTVAAMLGIVGVVPSGWTWAALGAYAVAWGEYLVTQTIGRSRGSSAVR